MWAVALQMTFDFLAIATTFFCSYLFYIKGLARVAPQSMQAFLVLSSVTGILYMLMLERTGLYRQETSLLNINEIRGIFRASLYSAFVVLALSFYWRSIDLSRITLTLAMIASPFALLFSHWLGYRVRLSLLQRGWAQQRVLIYGAGNIGRQLARRFFSSPGLGYLPVGFLDDSDVLQNTVIPVKGSPQKSFQGGLQVFGGEEFLSVAKAMGVDTVVIAIPSATFERNQQVVEQCLALGLKYVIVPNSYEKFVQIVEMFELGGIPILRHREFRVTPWYYLGKRIVDLVFSTFFLILLVPVFLVIAFAIRFDSPGPIIFKQKRVGYRGREFSFYKFRTMVSEAPKYSTSPSSWEDPRITPVGRWLRRTSLDELAQLFNVFRGDMSLVGPRPEMPFIVEKYSPLERLRLEAKPGITGVWQISSDRGEPIHHNLEYDLFYLANRSLLLDLSIIVKTITSVVRGVGAV